MPYLDVDSTGKVRIFGGEFESDNSWSEVREFEVLPEMSYIAAFFAISFITLIIFAHLLRVDFTNSALVLKNDTIADVNFTRPWMGKTIYISGGLVATIIFDSYFSGGASVIYGSYQSRGELIEGNFYCPFFKIINVKKTKLIL